ncbi:hypothetical protein HMPREF1370_02127 [Enterococcus faecium P1123]|uniref:Uncharacterized protein n=2 Tax=Enterococcus faecium TaxID=1352 RepID=Q9X559_ENTFC|nr:unknown [Enterococcus faecium]EEV46433.1 conserved hypothetical protein [Enterococcus faecium 1,231,502]EEV53219.1 conserved hypothetical protein [Enterococcus faecium 1,231,410]EEV62234.1 conserved hypothetical protein [Enterococcus faecium Com15]EFR77024.1 hypothetical protein HMPREF9527_02145 [Enterococcus faecium TX0133C]EJX45172.1 hypothetical protein HMPREF1381_00639 [Enterococcus faecium R501]EJX45515.1 hypothetical protein HMPREF1382_00424 [Enterococcus faecium S447]EJX48299.1 hyp
MQRKRNPITWVSFSFIIMMNQAFCFCHVCCNLYERVELATHNQPYFPSSLNTK